jgi:predicted RNase H-like HicB family nuclease
MFKGEDGFYIASADREAIFTQGKTFDELFRNIREATELYLEGEDMTDLGFTSKPSIFVNFELPQVEHA